MFLNMFSLVILYSIACFGTGKVAIKVVDRILNTSQTGSDFSLARISINFLLGQVVFGTIWLITGLTGNFSPLLVWIVVISGFVAGLYGIFYCRKGLRSIVITFANYFRNETLVWKAIISLIIFYILAFISTIGSEIAADAAYFYLTMPKVMAETHWLQSLPGKINYEKFGFVGELQHAALISMGSVEAARLFSWPTLISCLLLLTGIGALVKLGQRGKWLSLAMLLTSSGVMWFLGEGKVDTFSLAFALAAIYLMAAAQMPFVAGLFLGYSFVAKNPYIVSMLPMLGIFLLCNTGFFSNKIAFSQKWKKLVSYAIPYCGGAVLILLPHLLKNWVFFENLFPVSDYATHGLFNWSGWDNTPYTKRIYLTFPLDITFNLRGLSPLILAFLPVGFLSLLKAFKYRAALLWTSVAALAGSLSMMVVFPAMLFDVRFYLPALVLFIPIAASGAEFLISKKDQIRVAPFLVNFATLIILLWGIFWFSTTNVSIFEFEQTVAFLTGEIEDCEKSGEFGVLQPRCRSMLRLNQEAQPGTRILTNSFHTFWLRTDLIMCANSEFYPGTPVASEVEKTWQAIYHQGFEYLLYDADYESYLAALDLEHLPDWVELQMLYEDFPMRIYKINYQLPVSTSRQKTCQADPNSGWLVSTTSAIK